MQRFRKGKTGILAVARLLVFSLLIAGFSTNSMVSKAAVKGKEETAIKSVSLRIGEKKVNKKTYKMNQGAKKKLEVSVSPKKEEKTIQFTSSNENVVTVDKSGRITAVKTGSAKIKVTVEVNKKGTKESVKKTTWVKIKVVKAKAPEKSLVVYFSCTDTTKKVAEYVQQSVGADIYRIQPAEPYTAADLNYGNAASRATREQNDMAARPAIAGNLPDLNTYDVVYLGYPIWWGQAPKIIYSFLENCDLSGKMIVPFCTSHSSGIGSSATNLHSLADGSVTWLDGRRFSASTSKEEVIKWLGDLGMQSLLEQEREPVERVFDFHTKTVTLNSGYEMPLNGIGTYSLLGDTCVSSVSEALKRGVRLIDTAYMYHNDVICCEL